MGAGGHEPERPCGAARGAGHPRLCFHCSAKKRSLPCGRRLLRGLSPFCRTVRAGTILLLRKRGGYGAAGPKRANTGRVSRWRGSFEPCRILLSFYFLTVEAAAANERLLA